MKRRLTSFDCRIVGIEPSGDGIRDGSRVVHIVEERGHDGRKKRGVAEGGFLLSMLISREVWKEKRKTKKESVFWRLSRPRRGISSNGEGVVPTRPPALCLVGLFEGRIERWVGRMEVL